MQEEHIGVQKSLALRHLHLLPPLILHPHETINKTDSEAIDLSVRTELSGPFSCFLPYSVGIISVDLPSHSWTA